MILFIALVLAAALTGLVLRGRPVRRYPAEQSAHAIDRRVRHRDCPLCDAYRLGGGRG